MPHQMTELMPPRPTFIQDMTPEEMEVMQAHAGYWARLAERGISGRGVGSAWSGFGCRSWRSVGAPVAFPSTQP